MNANEGPIFHQNAPNILLFDGKLPKLWTVPQKWTNGILVDECERGSDISPECAQNAIILRQMTQTVDLFTQMGKWDFSR